MSDARKIATVTQINNYLKALFEQVPILQNVWIKGEISNFKLHSSGNLLLIIPNSETFEKQIFL